MKRISDADLAAIRIRHDPPESPWDKAVLDLIDARAVMREVQAWLTKLDNDELTEDDPTTWGLRKKLGDHV